MELEHLKKVFIEVNNFPLAVVKRVIKNVEHGHHQQQPSNNDVQLEETKTRVTYKAKRLASWFQLKDQVKKKHEHNVVYEIEKLSSIGENGRRIEERF